MSSDVKTAILLRRPSFRMRCLVFVAALSGRRSSLTGPPRLATEASSRLQKAPDIVSLQVTFSNQDPLQLQPRCQGGASNAYVGTSF